ncbi:molecular chaperone HtpG, partial [bacterium]|nr:molecular chaperone HtpG [bacterium]
TDSKLLSADAAEISITLNKKRKTIAISDSGIGLDQEDLIEALGTIARSGTKAFIEQIEEAAEKDKDAISLIGQFGVGFYASFMVADKVEVHTLKAGQDQGYSWQSDGQSGYEINASSARDTVGTTVVLHLKKEAKEFLEDIRIQTLVKKYSDHIAYPIQLMKDDQTSEVLNSVEALWTKPAKDITQEQYNNFYQSHSGQYDTPFLTLHNKAEGAVEFTNLLFLPSQKPFDLFDPERKTKVQLYVNRVFITDELKDLIPEWLRFVRGIIDTASLDLNVSREMLQHNATLLKIRKAVTKRVLSELAKKVKKDAQAYEAFWANFGRVLKEGIYEDADNRDRILKICRFYSLKQDKMISLEDYIDAMPQTQDDIYYLASDSVEAAKRSPHIEGFAERDIDVLLMTDPIDEFWISTSPKYSEKSLISIARENVDLSKFAKEGEADEADDQNSDMSDVIVKLKAALGEKVSDIRVSSTLTSSPVRLVAADGGLDFNLERIMKAQNPDYTGSAKVLELNATHPIMQKLKAQPEETDQGLDALALVLFQQARILDGEMPEDPTLFIQNVNQLIASGI